MSPLPSVCALPGLNGVTLSEFLKCSNHTLWGSGLSHSGPRDRRIVPPKVRNPFYIIVPESKPEDVSPTVEMEEASLLDICHQTCLERNRVGVLTKGADVIVCPPCDMYPHSLLPRQATDPLEKARKEALAAERDPVRSRAKVEIYRSASLQYCKERCAAGLPSKEVRPASVIICPPCEEGDAVAELPGAAATATKPSEAAVPATRNSAATTPRPAFSPNFEPIIEAPDVSLRDIGTTHPWCYQAITLLPKYRNSSERAAIEREVSKLFDKHKNRIGYTLTWKFAQPKKDISDSLGSSEELVIAHACQLYIDFCMRRFPPSASVDAAMCLDAGFVGNPRARMTFQVDDDTYNGLHGTVSWHVKVKEEEGTG